MRPSPFRECDLPHRPALIFGGVSPEHEVSIMSATQVAAGLAELAEKAPMAVQPIYVNREGEWCFWRVETGGAPADAQVIARAQEWDLRPGEFPIERLSFPLALARLIELEVDAALILIHGAGGEDGKLQAAFDLIELPYSGSGAAASSLALHKAHCQAVLRAAGVAIPASASLRMGDREMLDVAVERIIETLGLPCVVKPVWGGSSFGVGIVRRRGELEPALEAAGAINDEVMIEQFIEGREVTCGVIDRNGAPCALPVTEILPPEGRFFDYEAKYEPGVSCEITPAELPSAVTKKIQKMSHCAHAVCGCRGFSRVDLMLDADLNPYVIEINTLPGMTRTSLLPQAAAVAGLDFPGLLGIMLGTATHD